jgi:hypothetical protein
MARVAMVYALFSAALWPACVQGSEPSAGAPRGALCDGTEACASGFCSDGVCCDGACAGPCEACNELGSIGTCGATPGEDVASDCAASAVCSVARRCAAEHVWSAGYGGAGLEVATDVAIASNGDVLVTGYFTDQLSLGGQLLGGSAGMFVARFDGDGEHLWSRAFGGGARPNAIASDGHGAVVVGSFGGDADIGAGPITADGIDGFVLRLDALGTATHVEQVGGASDQSVDRVAAQDGRIVFAGNFRGTLELGGTLQNAGSASSFIAMLDNDVVVWSKALSSAGNDQIGGVAIADDGRIAFTGAISAATAFGSTPLEHSLAEDVVVVMLAPDTSVIWARSFGGQGSDNGRAIDFATDGVVVAGFFTKGIDFGGDALLSLGCEDLFVLALDADGEHLWSRRYGDLEPQVPKDMALLPDGSVLVAGDFKGSMHFGWAPLISAGSMDAYLVRFDASGEPLWAQRYGDETREYLEGMAIDADGNALLVGRHDGQMSFGGDSLVSQGASDIFVAKIIP